MKANRNQLAQIVAESSLFFEGGDHIVTGNVKVGKELTFDGDVVIYGDVTADTVFVGGRLEVIGNLNANVVEAEGDIIVEGSANVADICGESIYVKENLESSVEIEAGIMIVEGNLRAFVVSLGNDEDEELEDVFLVDGRVRVDEAIYVNEKPEFISEEELELTD